MYFIINTRSDGLHRRAFTLSTTGDLPALSKTTADWTDPNKHKNLDVWDYKNSIAEPRGIFDRKLHLSTSSITSHLLPVLEYTHNTVRFHSQTKPSRLTGVPAPRDHHSTGRQYLGLIRYKLNVSIRSQRAQIPQPKCIQNWRQSNEGKYTKKEKRRGKRAYS